MFSKIFTAGKLIKKLWDWWPTRPRFFLWFETLFHSISLCYFLLGFWGRCRKRDRPNWCRFNFESMPNRGQFQRSSSGLKGSKYVLLQLLFSHHSNGNQAFFLKRRVNIFFILFIRLVKTVQRVSCAIWQKSGSGWITSVAMSR